jgi:hypothetical protein
MHDLHGHQVEVGYRAPNGEHQPIFAITVTRIAEPNDSRVAIAEAMEAAVHGAAEWYCAQFRNHDDDATDLVFHCPTLDRRWEYRIEWPPDRPGVGAA